MESAFNGILVHGRSFLMLNSETSESCRVKPDNVMKEKDNVLTETYRELIKVFYLDLMRCRLRDYSGGSGHCGTFLLCEIRGIRRSLFTRCLRELIV